MKFLLTPLSSPKAKSANGWPPGDYLDFDGALDTLIT